MKIYVPNYYQAGGAIDRGIAAQDLPVYDDGGSILIQSSGSNQGTLNWIQSSFVPIAGNVHRLWNVEMAFELTVPTDPSEIITITIAQAFPVPLVTSSPLVGYFTTGIQPNAMNAFQYWTAHNDAQGNVVLTFIPTPEIVGINLEIVYVNLTLATLIQT